MELNPPRQGGKFYLFTETALKTKYYTVKVALLKSNFMRYITPFKFYTAV
jgi:hypothetical protein